MRLAVILVVIVATFVANGAMGFARAEDTTHINNSKRIASDNIVKRLRASQKVGADSKIQSTQNIVHAVEHHEPLPKWAVALVALLGLGAAAGTVYGGVKATEALSNVMSEKDSQG
ncbi:hypothetical protein PF010_g18650 [Phytophthora fragariae]|uniref:RxLR effector protein n=1 Tax=Phytophthora fragariae TaxID=53985 RepID=A0A6A3EU18_9STRA|nr:hypothetical protein PF003_g7086 [Phytophthora fragariae]KAE8933518.1 hypothetical protein PF009_g16476 [Phytophthora fragariae]KAE9090282.1 hypothetical protein PF010_g18650 [Phytophthora fragariae]KAE9117576.1 hypothetical protein PF006_g18784 [Phytophthora fragariae]KAE9316195.1 hypothetical protein PF008_g19065 [Phytophthora fragariae]